MNREELIKKWLDHDLNQEDLKAFEALEEYNELIQLSMGTGQFAAPNYEVEAELAKVKSKLKKKNKGNIAWFKPLLRIAAAVVIGMSIYFYTTTLDTNVTSLIAQQISVQLPDASSVVLNADSKLTFNKKEWHNDREVKLEGEAYFKVAKGSVFDVITNDGKVSVLGTQFNVIQRDHYFEVTCYEGLVAVQYKNELKKLPPGEQFKVIDGKIIATEKEISLQPNWILGESNFKSTPLKYVLAELTRQYDVKLNPTNIDTNRMFSGSFTHKNLDLALKSITLPLNLGYKISGDTITINGE